MTQQDFRHSSSTLKASAKPMVDQASAVTSSRRAGVLSLVLLAVTILGLTAVIRAIPGTPDASAQSPVPSQRPATAQAPKRSQPAVTT